MKFESSLFWLRLRNSDRWRNGNTCYLEHIDGNTLAFCSYCQDVAVFFQRNFLKHLQVLLDIGPFKLEALAESRTPGKAGRFPIGLKSQPPLFLDNICSRFPP
jgi:hypothetical protein